MDVAQSKADVEEYTETAGENEAISFNVSTTDDVIGFILQNENGKENNNYRT